jgi:subtilase-type serine protease
MMLTGEWLLGAALGYSPTDWDSDVNGSATSRGKVKTPLAMAYARWQAGPWQLRMNAGYAAPKFETTREVAIGASTSTVHSDHGGREWSAAAEIEYTPPATNRWQLRPLASVRYAHLREEAFTETGSATAALSVDERTTSNTNLGVGARLLMPFANDRGGWELRAVYSHLAGDTDSPISARLAGQPATFSASGTPLKRNALTVGGGLAGGISKTGTAFADVSYETRGSGQDAYAFTLGARWGW